MPTEKSTTPARTWSNWRVASPSEEPAGKKVIAIRPSDFSSISFAHGSSASFWMKWVDGNIVEILRSYSAAMALVDASASASAPRIGAVRFMVVLSLLCFYGVFSGTAPRQVAPDQSISLDL